MAFKGGGMRTKFERTTKCRVSRQSRAKKSGGGFLLRGTACQDGMLSRYSVAAPNIKPEPARGEFRFLL